jgi:hypothetical protein
MVLRNAAAHRDKRLLLPVARDMMKACCPRFLRLALEQEDLQAMSDNSDDEADGVVDDSIEKLARCAAPIIAPPPLYLSLSRSISLSLLYMFARMLAWVPSPGSLFVLIPSRALQEEIEVRRARDEQRQVDCARQGCKGWRGRQQQDRRGYR